MIFQIIKVKSIDVDLEKLPIEVFLTVIIEQTNMFELNNHCFVT